MLTTFNHTVKVNTLLSSSLLFQTNPPSKARTTLISPVTHISQPSWWTQQGLVRTHHHREGVLRHGLGTEAFCCCEGSIAWIQLEKSCAFGVHTAMDGVDEPLSFVLVCCTDSKDFSP